MLNVSSPLPAELIGTIDTWHAGEEFLFYTTCGALDDTVHRLSLTELAAVHPELPSRLQSITQFRRRTGNRPELASHYIDCQARHLMHPLTIPTLGGTTPWVYRVSEFEWDGAAKSAHLFAITYELADMLPGTVVNASARVAEFVARCCPRSLLVPTAWLDEQFPDWQTRYRLSHELGLSKSDAIAYITQPAVQPLNVVLPGISFD